MPDERVHLLLPLESYHVTLIGLWVRKSYSSVDAYNQHNASQLAKLTALDAQLVSQFPAPFAMLANVEHAHQQFRVDLTPDETSRVVYHNQQNTVKSAYPSLPLPSPHMSLGYRRNNKARFTPAEEERVAAVCRTLPRVLHFGTPRVCAFKDMINFVPVFSASGK